MRVERRASARTGSHVEQAPFPERKQGLKFRRNEDAKSCFRVGSGRLAESLYRGVERERERECVCVCV
jgi:hypothetical protein